MPEMLEMVQNQKGACKENSPPNAVRVGQQCFASERCPGEMREDTELLLTGQGVRQAGTGPGSQGCCSIPLPEAGALLAAVPHGSAPSCDLLHGSDYPGGSPTHTPLLPLRVRLPLGCRCVAFQNAGWVCMPLLLCVSWLRTQGIHNSTTTCQQPQLFCTFPNLLSGVFSSAPNAAVELQTVTTCPLLFSEMAAIHTADVAVLKLP